MRRINKPGAANDRRTRREFLTDAAVMSAGASVAACFPKVGGEWPSESENCRDRLPPKLRTDAAPVVSIYDEASVVTEPDIEIQGAVVETMVDKVLAGMTSGEQAPWRELLPDYTSGMRIGLKVNCLNQQCPTSVPVVKALTATLREHLGVDPEEIIVWDRRLDELTRSGFTDDAVGAKVMGTIISTTDSGGPGYQEGYCVVTSAKTTRLSRILTELTDVTINCPVLKTHGISGVTAGMKNIYGVIDNPGDFHGDLNTTLPALYNLAPVRNRMRVTVVDALLTVTVGGTSSPLDTVARRVLASTDPLAVDRSCLALVNQLRGEKDLDLPDVDPSVLGWMDNAYELGLGAREFRLIEV